MAINLVGTGQLQAQEAAVVLLDPQTLTLNQGQTISVAVRIEGATNLYGAQIDLSFDAGKIKVLDGDAAKPGVQILAGDFLARDEGFVATNSADNETGQVTFAHSLLFPAEPASGSGTLVEFEVEALETGSSDLLFDSVILASPEGTQLPVQLEDNPQDNANSGGIIVATTAAADAAPTATATTGNSPVTTAPTAVATSATATAASQTPSSTTEAAQSTAVSTPATADPDNGDTRLPAITESAASEAAEIGSSGITPAQTAAAAAAQQPAGPSTSEAADADQAAEIVAAPVPAEEDSLQSAAQPSPVLTVIGQNQLANDRQAQPATPAPATDDTGILEGSTIAIGLVLLFVALIAIWFLRRLLVGTK